MNRRKQSLATGGNSCPLPLFHRKVENVISGIYTGAWRMEKPIENTETDESARNSSVSTFVAQTLCCSSSETCLSIFLCVACMELAEYPVFSASNSWSQ